MDRQIIAIGGGGFGRNPGIGIIEKYILEQSKKKYLTSALFLRLLVMMSLIKLVITQL